MTGVPSSEPWPPQCCVPAFAEAALRQLGVACPDRATLARTLGVRVGPGQANPFGLPVAAPPEPTGVAAAGAERAINLLCQGLSPSVRFRHVPFLTIDCEAWEEVLREARDNGAVVGAGVAYRRLDGSGPSRSDWHVLRIVGGQGGTLSVRDDSGEAAPAEFDVDRERLLAAVLAIPDGFWIMGPEEGMSLRFTLPWSGSR